MERAPNDEQAPNDGRVPPYEDAEQENGAEEAEMVPPAAVFHQPQDLVIPPEQF